LSSTAAAAAAAPNAVDDVREAEDAERRGWGWFIRHDKPVDDAFCYKPLDCVCHRVDCAVMLQPMAFRGNFAPACPTPLKNSETDTSEVRLNFYMASAPL